MLSVNVNLSIENCVEFHYPVFTRALRSEGLPYLVLPLSVMLMMLLWVRGCATFQLQLDYGMAVVFKKTGLLLQTVGAT